MDLASIARKSYAYRKYFIYGRIMLHYGRDHQHSQRKYMIRWKSPCYSISSTRTSPLHQLVGWKFRWLPHRPSHFSGTRLWLRSPSFSWGTFKWIIGTCVLQYSPSLMVSTRQCSTILQSWHSSVALRKLFRMLDWQGREGPAHWPPR
jgi:hypothetical protein